MFTKQNFIRFLQVFGMIDDDVYDPTVRSAIKPPARRPREGFPLRF